MFDDAPLDSSQKIAELRIDFEDDGVMSGENIQFMFDYIDALELGLQFSAGAGLTQAESDAADENNPNHILSSYVIDALEEDSRKSESGR